MKNIVTGNDISKGESFTVNSETGFYIALQGATWKQYTRYMTLLVKLT